MIEPLVPPLVPSDPTGGPLPPPPPPPLLPELAGALTVPVSAGDETVPESDPADEVETVPVSELPLPVPLVVVAGAETVPVSELPPPDPELVVVLVAVAAPPVESVPAT
jgi:hypothetical protein